MNTNGLRKDQRRSTQVQLWVILLVECLQSIIADIEFAERYVSELELTVFGCTP